MATVKMQRQNKIPYVSSHTMSFAMPGNIFGSDSMEAPSILNIILYSSVSFTVIVKILESGFA